MLIPDEVESVECVYQRVQGIGSHSPIQSHGEIGRVLLTTSRLDEGPPRSRSARLFPRGKSPAPTRCIRGMHLLGQSRPASQEGRTAVASMFLFNSIGQTRTPNNQSEAHFFPLRDLLTYGVQSKPRSNHRGPGHSDTGAPGGLLHEITPQEIW